MRVCHIITRMISGGAEENTLLSCNGQVAAGHDVHLIHGPEYDDRMLARLDSRVRVIELRSLRRSIMPGSDLRAVAECTGLVRRIRPDIVHTHESKAGVIGRVAAALARTPYIIHGVHILPFINVGRLARFAYLGVERALAPLTDLFICVGEEMRRASLEAGVGRPTQYEVVPSGMDVDRFIQARQRAESWRAVLGDLPLATPTPRFLVLVSRLEERKGQHRFLPVFARLAARHPDLVLLIVGEGPQHAALAAEIQKRGLEGRVVLTGHRVDVERLMALGEIGLLTSIREGLPRVLVQYALAGLPSVATDIPGVREILRPGETGFVVPPDDLDSMEKCIDELLENAPRRDAMRGAIASTDLGRWSIATMISQLEALYARAQRRAPAMQPS